MGSLDYDDDVDDCVDADDYDVGDYVGVLMMMLMVMIVVVM